MITQSILSALQDFAQESFPVSSDASNLRDQLLESEAFLHFLRSVQENDIYSPELNTEFQAAGFLEALAPVRQLRCAFSLPLSAFGSAVTKAIQPLSSQNAEHWESWSKRFSETPLGESKLLPWLKSGSQGEFLQEWEDRLVANNPHAIYPTSPYRSGSGHVVATPDHQRVEAVMTSQTYTSIEVVEGVLSPEQKLLAEIYQPHDRCVALVDTNVEEHFGSEIEAYFEANHIPLKKLVYRAMEVDKGIHTVERMLGDFKELGVSRNEPVLLVGGGVLADTGGLACALYHRSTPYVMLSTSIVAGIDAGPSPRTCCDGFGYKNLFGAYQAPLLSITDRYFFRTLREGWLRHGIAEIIKMACVKDFALFEALEEVGPRLITTRFGTLDVEPDDPIHQQSRHILGLAIQSYVESEYDNLYETHQCRPHAFGHTWSPGFEIPAGMLHGHAISVGMGYNSYLSHLQGWISREQLDRILKLIGTFELSLYHPILEQKSLIWEAQLKMEQKRGGHLVAPMPKGELGQCGYLASLSREDLYQTLDDYGKLCSELPHGGLGTEVHCHEVGLEHPGTVGDGDPIPAAA
ncbi:MAG: sedoheptulose 7-phosphate cyclase [Verrucomicrobiota bacterium]